jgi:hypothetical protein
MMARKLPKAPAVRSKGLRKKLLLSKDGTI